MNYYQMEKLAFHKEKEIRQIANTLRKQRNRKAIVLSEKIQPVIETLPKCCLA
ncbi:hypothetical protein [Bacillus sp. HMF5848]|uniref:hypothetical protein n=1 Tax=Bacillus sp. HMF5848 TaxID=2495421 RepID=UPI00163AB085|nr:hypothetical protein [Bacillus sp. HMF5848]